MMMMMQNMTPISVIRGAREEVYSWSGGWTVRCVHGKILSTEQMYAWKRELNLYGGQHIPEALFGESSLELRHDATGVRVRFTALEALRAWNSLQLSADNVRVQRSKGISAKYEIESDYDFTYTSAYAGGTDVARFIGEHLPVRPDTGSPIARPAADLACGEARLRKPLCKCKGYGGRVPLVRAKGAAAACAIMNAPNAGHRGNTTTTTAVNTSLSSSRIHPSPSSSSNGEGENDRVHDEAKGPERVPPKWVPSDEEVDVRRLVASDRRPPLFYDNVDLYEDDMHECGMLMLRARVVVTENFIVAYQRYFLRVDGVRARVLDSRYVIRRGSTVVVRERTWNEGTWDELIRGAAAEGRVGVSIEAVNDSVAAERLPPLRAPIVEALELPTTSTWIGEVIPSSQVSQTHHAHASSSSKPLKRETLWTHELRSTAPICASDVTGGLVFTITDAGRRIACFAATTGETAWSRDAGRSDDGALALALAPSPNTSDGGRLAIGYDRGNAAVWRMATGEPLFTFIVSPRIAARVPSGNRSSTAGWVERLAWSGDGESLGAAAGRSVAMVHAMDGSSLATHESASGSVTSIAFGGGGRLPLAVGGYGALRWIAPESHDAPPPLSRGASAVLCVAVSPDGRCAAMGCLDKTMRMYRLDSPAATTITDNGEGGDKSSSSSPSNADDWVGGFDAGVTHIAWSHDGEWLAAAGGTALVVVPRGLAAGEAPILCRTPGTPAPDCGRGTCGRFDAIAWQPPSTSRRARFSSILVGLEASARKVHVFDVERTDLCFPRKCAPLATLTLPVSDAESPAPAVGGSFAFVPADNIHSSSGVGGRRSSPDTSTHISLALSSASALSVVRLCVDPEV